MGKKIIVPIEVIERRILIIRGHKVMEVVTKCDHLKQLKFSPNLPYAFTEHGAIMLATVLNSPAAVKVSIQVVRAFARLRQMLAGNVELARKLEALEKKYDTQFKVIFDAIHQLMVPPEPKKRKIGFQVREHILRYRNSRRQ